MTKDTERVRGYAVVRSENAAVSQRSVSIANCTFSMEGVFTSVDEDFVAEVVQPLAVSSIVPPSVAAASGATAAAAESAQQQAAAAIAASTATMESTDDGQQPQTHDAATATAPPRLIAPSRAILAWAGGSNRDPRALADSSVLRATLNTIVASNPDATICTGTFSTTLGAAPGGSHKWSQWARRAGSPRSSRNATPPSSARGDAAAAGSPGGGDVTPRFSGLAAKEFDAFRHFRVEGESVLGLFPLKTTPKTRVAEPPKPYCTLTSVQELLMQFHTVASFCLSNRDASAPGSDDAVVVVDIIVANPATEADVSSASAAATGGAAPATSSENTGSTTTISLPASIFRVRYVHCLSAGAVRQLLSSSSRVALSANIAAEIFGNCRTHCVLLYNDPQSLVQQQQQEPHDAEKQQQGNNNNTASDNQKKRSSAALIRDEAEEEAHLKNAKHDFQLLTMARSMMNYVSSKPPRFSPEALLSYLGVRMIEASRAHHSSTAVEAAVAVAAAAAAAEQHQNQQPVQQEQTVANEDDVGSPPAAQQQSQQPHQQQQPRSNTSTPQPTDRSTMSGGAAGAAAAGAYGWVGDSDTVLRLRRELVALNDLVVELRSRALRSEELLREERTRSARLHEENQMLKARVLGTATISSNSGAAQYHSPSSAAEHSGNGSSRIPPHVLDLQKQQQQQQQNQLGSTKTPRGGSASASNSLQRTGTNASAGAAAALSRQSTNVTLVRGRTQSPLARHPSSTTTAGGAAARPQTPRAIAAQLDQATRRASPPSTSAAVAGFRSEPPWAARRAVSNGRLTARTAEERRALAKQPAAHAAVGGRTNHNGEHATGDATSLRVVTTHTRPKLVTAVRGQPDEAPSSFAKTRLIRHAEYEDPHEIAAAAN